jgi:hypothetical protein
MINTNCKPSKVQKDTRIKINVCNNPTVLTLLWRGAGWVMEGQDQIRTVTAEIYEGCPESNVTYFFLSEYLFPNQENYTL